MYFPFFSNSSVILRTIAIGNFISANWIVKNRFLSKFEASTMFKIKSKSPPLMASRAMRSSAVDAERVYTPGKSSMRIMPEGETNSPLLPATVTPE